MTYSETETFRFSLVFKFIAFLCDTNLTTEPIMSKFPDQIRSCIAMQMDLVKKRYQNAEILLDRIGTVSEQTGSAPSSNPVDVDCASVNPDAQNFLAVATNLQKEASDADLLLDNLIRSRLAELAHA